MDGPPEKVVPVLKKFHAAGKGVLGMKIIGEGRRRNDDEKHDVSMKFTLGLGCVDVLNVGGKSVPGVDDLAARVKRVSRPACGSATGGVGAMSNRPGRSVRSLAATPLCATTFEIS